MRWQGVEPESLRPVEKALLASHAASLRDQRFYEVIIIVKAIMTAAKIVATGEGDAGKLQDLIKDYTDLVYPENAVEKEDAASKALRIIEKEVARGPLKVVAQEYKTSRKKKRRR